MQRRLRLALVAGEGQRNAEMPSHAASSTVNWRIPAKLQFHPAEEALLNEGRPRVLPYRLQCPNCLSMDTNLDRHLFGHTMLRRHSCNNCGIRSDWKKWDSPNQLPGAECRENAISIQQVDENLPFTTEDRIPPPSNPSATEENLGGTSRGERSSSFQGKWDANDLPLHKQLSNRRKSDTPRRLHFGEYSQTPSSSSAMPATSSAEQADDHPLNTPEGSVLHSAYLVLLAHKSVEIDYLVDYFESEPSTTAKFPDNWQEQLENLLMGNRHFLQTRRGLFSVSLDSAQAPSTRVSKDL